MRSSTIASSPRTQNAAARRDGTLRVKRTDVRKRVCTDVSHADKSQDGLYQNLVCSAAFALGGLLGREWPGVDWTMEAEDDLRSGEAPSNA